MNEKRIELMLWVGVIFVLALIVYGIGFDAGVDSMDIRIVVSANDDMFIDKDMNFVDLYRQGYIVLNESKIQEEAEEYIIPDFACAMQINGGHWSYTVDGEQVTMEEYEKIFKK